jgi:glycerophosphoryl diester phosphodiesterase
LKRPVVIGHRGAAAVAPENTAVSIRAGLDAGADAIEIDVGASLDGHPVLLHDVTLDRTTNGRGTLAERPWRYLRNLDAGSWFAPRFAGERLIDLDSALAIVRGRAPIIVEMKSRARRPLARPDAADLRFVATILDALRRGRIRHAVTVSGAHWAVVAAVKKTDPRVDIALTVSPRHRADPVAAARRCGASALHAHRLMCRASFVGRAHEAGLKVFSYTVNRRGELKRVLASGVDGFFTDDPRLLAGLIRELTGGSAD